MDHPHYDPLDVLRAMTVARDVHSGQLRSSSLKNQPLPYFMHLVDVVAHLNRADAGREFSARVYVVGFLHDTVEDTAYTLSNVRRDFGPEVEHNVFLLTLPETAAREPYKTPHQIAAMEATDTPNLVRAVKIADKMSNVIDMIRYPPDWELRSIQGYVASAGKVVGAAISHGKNSDTISKLADVFWEEYEKVVQHFGVG